MKLQMKVIYLMTTTLVVVGIISGATMLYYQQKNSVQQFEHMATMMAGAVQASLEQGMLAGEPGPVQEAIMRITREEMLSGLVLLAGDGRVVASNNIAQIGRVSTNEEVLRTLSTGRVSVWTEDRNGTGELSVISPVINKLECRTCHSSDAVVLGGIQVSLGTGSVQREIRQQTTFFAIFGIITLYGIFLVLTLTLRQIVLKPLSRLADSAQKLSRGEYATRTPSDADDEIGTLARTFNEMAESVEQRSRELEDSRQKLASWNQDLEREVEHRTNQLSAANRLRDQLLEKLISAQEEERRRIARELHDEASQSLAASVLHLENIAESLPQKYGAEKRRLGMLKEQLEQTLNGMRGLALELRPSILDHLGLSKAIEWYARDYLGKHSIEARVDVDDVRLKLPSHTQTMVFRILQEALTNVVKHAQASQVSVKMHSTDSKVTLQIDDNGHGFDAGAALTGTASQSSLGIHGMIERATLLGGKLDIRSEPGKGTGLTIEIPLARETL